MKKTKATTPIAKAKTTEEILNQLGLPHTQDHLKIAQAAINDGAQIRAQLRGRAHNVMDRLQGFVQTIKKLGVQDIGELIKEFVRDKKELKKLKERVSDAEQALLDAHKLIPADERAEFSETHRLAIRRAKDAHPPSEYHKPVECRM